MGLQGLGLRAAKVFRCDARELLELKGQGRVASLKVDRRHAAKDRGGSHRRIARVHENRPVVPKALQPGAEG